MVMTRRHHIILLVLTVVLFVLPGCSTFDSEYFDDFSDPASGWGAASHETYVRGYQQGEYLIQIDVPEWFVWTTAGLFFEDAEIEAAVRYAGQTDNHFGAICRYNAQSFYYFAVSSDGYYGIFKHEPNGQLVSLTGNDMVFSPIIRLEGMANRLSVVCQEQRLALYINGQLLAEVENSDLIKGDVGIAAGTLKTGGTSIWFDDFKVRSP
jgi:hypothetical protein